MSTATRCPLCKSHDIDDAGVCPHCDYPCQVAIGCEACEQVRRTQGKDPA